jgi:glucose-1-phosphate cytidylyltransferase
MQVVILCGGQGTRIRDVADDLPKPSLRLDCPDQVQVHGTSPEDRWCLTLAETGLEAMTRCRVKRIEKYITSEHFLLTYGDAVADINLRQLVAFHLGHDKIGTVTAVRPPGRFGELDLDGRKVVAFNEKLLPSRGRISGGFFVFHRCIFERLQDDLDLIFEQAPLRQLAQDGELMAYLHNGFWQPMDNSRDYRYLNELWSQGKAPWNTWDTRRQKAIA